MVGHNSSEVTTGMEQGIVQEDGRVPVVVIRPWGPTFPEVIEYLGSANEVQLVECATSLEAVSIANQFDRCVLLFHAIELRDVVKHVTMLKFLKESIELERVRPIITTYIEQISVLQKLSIFGCQEVIREPIPSKSLIFKLNRSIKALIQLNLVQEVKPDSSGRSLARDLGLGFEAKESNVGLFRYLPPLAIESDFWFYPEGSPRRIGRRWLVKMKGPAPSVGKFEMEGSEENWIWTPVNRLRHPFQEKEGVWRFKGQSPLFKKDTWWLVGVQPELMFYVRGECKGEKVGIDPSGILTVSKNSETAIRALPLFEVQASRYSALEKETESKKIKASLANEATLDPKRGLKNEHKVRLIEPLTLQSDFWLLEGRLPKWINGHWIIRLLGPSPAYGHWAEVAVHAERKKSEGGGEKFWRWVSNNPDRDPYLLDPGTWEFVGFQPKFDPKIDKGAWIFVSENPQFNFTAASENGISTVLATKVSLDSEGVLLVASDSQSAIQLLGIDPQSTKPLSGSSKGDQTLFRLDAAQFGNPPGKWRIVGEPGTEFGASSSSKALKQKYIYIPFANINELSEAIPFSKMEYYWVYSGKVSPEYVSAGKKHWIFRGWTPVKISVFSKLDSEVQRYLENMEAPEPVFSLEERKKALAEFKKNFKLNVPVLDRALTLELTQPRLSPLALSLLMSELICRFWSLIKLSAQPPEVQVSSSAKEMARSFCQFVSGSFDGVRTELWFLKLGHWKCANTLDGSEGQYPTSFGVVEFFPQVTVQGTLVAPIIRRRTGQNNSEQDVPPGFEEEIVGALVFGGQGVEKVSADSAQGYSMMAHGLIQAFL